MDSRIARHAIASCAFLAQLACVATASAQASISESRLRDELVKHFALDNLVPVFLPRGQEVGDVLNASGALLAKRSTCFPSLKVLPRQGSDSLREMTLDLKAEGSFGIGLKSIVKFFTESNAKTTTSLKLSFYDQQYVSAPANELKKAFSRKECPFLINLVDGMTVSADSFGSPPLVIQEVFYARKRVSVGVDKSGDVQATLSGVQTAVGSLGGKVAVKGSAEQGIVVEATDAVPIAVRLAFLPRPISGVLLGGGGSPAVESYYWLPSGENPVTDRQAMEVISQNILKATSGAKNPLLTEP